MRKHESKWTCTVRGRHSRMRHFCTNLGSALPLLWAPHKELWLVPGQAAREDQAEPQPISFHKLVNKNWTWPSLLIMTCSAFRCWQHSWQSSNFLKLPCLPALEEMDVRIFIIKIENPSCHVLSGGQSSGAERGQRPSQCPGDSQNQTD